MSPTCAEAFGFTPVDTAGIAELAMCSREHATDRLTKRPGFPKPRINLSRKMRYWDRDDVVSYLLKPRRRAGG